MKVNNEINSTIHKMRLQRWNQEVDFLLTLCSLQHIQWEISYRQLWIHICVSGWINAMSAFGSVLWQIRCEHLQCIGHCARPRKCSESQGRLVFTVMELPRSQDSTSP